MKRIGILILFIFIFLGLGESCYSQSPYSTTLTRIENSLFGIDYSSQSDDARIKRIEETVYGSASSSPINQRMSKLSKDLAADQMGQEIKPKTDTFANDEDEIKEDIPKSDKTVDYPVVNGLEQKVFNKAFKDLEITQRLSNLEQKVFKKTYNDDLNSRVDRLKTAVMPQTMANQDSGDDYAENNSYHADSNDTQDLLSQQDFYKSPDSNFSTGGASSIPSYNRQNSVLDNYGGSSDVTIPLAAMEKKILKKSYPNDEVSNRLSRLELVMFNSEFSNDDEQTRVDRLSSAYQAKKSSARYDSNKFSQHAATAMQLGAILLMILAAIL